jgi:hypothetical protein
MKKSNQMTVAVTKKPQHALPPDIVMGFCNLCNDAYEFWRHHLKLFDNNPRQDELLTSHAGPEFARLSIISQEYSLLQIIRLHDKPSTGGNANLGISYVLQEGAWSASVRDQLAQMESTLELFAARIKDARNKAIAHNDLSALLAGNSLGAFEKDAEVSYFEILQEFVNVVHDQVIGGIFPFSTCVENDVAAFLETTNPARAIADRLPYKPT